MGRGATVAAALFLLVAAAGLLAVLVLFAGDAPPPRPEDSPPSAAVPPAEPGARGRGDGAGAAPPDEAVSPEAAVLLSGRVLFADGGPAPGTAVTLAFTGTVLLGSGTDRRAFGGRAETDRDGRFVFRAGRGLESLPERYRLTARLLDRYAILDDQRGDSPPDLVLEDGLVVRGRIADGAGNPVAGAAASLWAARDGLEEYHTLVAVSDGAGHVEYHPLGRSEGWHFVLTVTHEGYPETEVELSTEKLLAGEPFEAILPTGVKVLGALVDADGRPLKGLHLAVAGRDGANLDLLPVPRAVTDEAGRFALDGVPAGEALVLASEEPPDLFARVPVPHLVAEVRERNGTCVDLGRIVLGARGTIRGMVVEQGGLPVEGATVSAGLDILGLSPSSGVTGPDGRFEIGGLPPGEYEVTAQRPHPTRGTIAKTVPGVRPGDAGIVIDVTGGGAVVFHLHPADRPAELLPVSSFSCSYEPLPRPEPAADGSFSSTMGASSHRSGAEQAHWRVTLDAGTYAITVRVSGFAPVDLGEVTVHPDRDTELDVPLTPE